ncbi:hypothetical protein BD769DRAFT_1449424 [Suillus cothurnatus]|nr:hypothetical protein BD769DRAFT_1449424 [Suillus cothurnatus]
MSFNIRYPRCAVSDLSPCAINIVVLLSFCTPKSHFAAYQYCFLYIARTHPSFERCIWVVEYLLLISTCHFTFKYMLIISYPAIYTCKRRSLIYILYFYRLVNYTLFYVIVLSIGGLLVTQGN